MVNLEELSLNFFTSSGLITDGTILTKYCLNQIPRLHKFTFCIYSKIIVNHLGQLLSNEDIKRTFGNYPNNQIVSSIDYFPQRNEFSQVERYGLRKRWYTTVYGKNTVVNDRILP